jgi:hypothetical protein
MPELDEKAMEYLGYMELIVDELKKRHFPNQELAFPALCALRLRNSLCSVQILVENSMAHDAVSCLRLAFETVILLVGFYRIPDFKRRRQSDYLKDRKDLLIIKQETSNFDVGETEAIVQAQVDGVLQELAQNEKEGFLPFGDIHKVADACGLLPLKKHFYKLMCLSAHPTTHTLSKYSDTSIPINFIEHPEKDDTGYISEMVYNIVAIAASILDEHLKLGIKLPTVEELLTTL